MRNLYYNSNIGVNKNYKYPSTDVFSSSSIRAAVMV